MHKIGFIGAGGIARAHAFSLNSLRYYYDDAPEIRMAAVTSARKESREAFAEKYGFETSLDIDEFQQSEELDTIFILGPNKVHYEHLQLAMDMPNVSHIYLEKPVCSTQREEELIMELFEEAKDRVNIQVGFQFVQNPAVREALDFWKSGILGNPIHFEIKYLHGDYLQKSYRDKRKTRLTSAPDGGAMADLGSHAISMIVAFMGTRIQILHGTQAGHFEDVPEDSDLFSTLTVHDPSSKSVGTISASRISSGTGDTLAFEFYGTKGSLRFNSNSPDYFEYYLEEHNQWNKMQVGSHYKPITSFPSGHVPGGWLRSMMHAHYLFLGGKDQKAFIPDLPHGLAVQKLVRETASYLEDFRKQR